MNKEILKLAVPNIISNISIPLLSTVDTALMGHISAEHLGAVGIGSMIFNFLYWNFGFLRMGTTGMTAQAFGANDNEEAGNIFGRALFLAITISILMLVLSKPLCELGLSLMNVTPGQDVLVSEYFYIRILAAPATLALYCLFGWFFGLQNAIVPLVLTLIINVTNIILSALFVKSFGWGVQGVAYGTLIAQYLGLLSGIIISLIFFKERVSSLKLKSIFILKKLIRFLNINKDIFIRTIFLSSTFAFIYSQSSSYGELVLASNIVLLQFLNWMSYGIDGFAYAAESLVGKYFGAKQENQLLKSIKLSLFWGAILAILYMLIYLIFGHQIIRIFTDQLDVIVAAEKRLIWMIVLPVIAFGSYIWDGIFIGLTAVRSMRNSMLISFLVFLASFYLLRIQIGDYAIWISLSLFLLARGAIQTYLFNKYRFSLK